jgi:hypothetical protein
MTGVGLATRAPKVSCKGKKKTPIIKYPTRIQKLQILKICLTCLLLLIASLLNGLLRPDRVLEVLISDDGMVFFLSCSHMLPVKVASVVKLSVLLEVTLIFAVDEGATEY